MSNRPRRRIRADPYLAALLIFPIFLFAVGDAHADEDDLDGLIGGFDDDSDFGGFDDDSDFASSDEIDEPGSGHPAWLARLPFGEWIAERTDLSGSLGVGAVYSYLDHKVPHGDEVGRSTSYGNLTRLDIDGAARPASPHADSRGLIEDKQRNTKQAARRHLTSAAEPRL